jgi:putative ABC transport system permease protein
MWSYVWSQLRHRRRRAIAVAGAVALGAALFVTLTSLGAGFRAAARAPLADVAADLIVTRPVGKGEAAPSAQATRGVRLPFGLATFNAGEVRGIQSVQGVTATAGSLQIWDFGARSTVTIAGVDPAQQAVGPGRVLARNMVEGRSFHPGENDVAVLDRHFAQFYNVRVGGKVTVGQRQIPVIGMVEVRDSSQAAAANVYLPLTDAQRLAGLGPDRVNEIHVQVRSSADTGAVTSRINRTVGPVSAITTDSLVQIMGAVGRISARFSTVAAVVGAVGGLLLSWTALRGMVAERIHEIGLLMAVGWRRRDVVSAFRLEALLLSLAGAVMGILLGLALAALLTFVPVPELQAGPPEAAGGHATAAGETTLPMGLDPLNLAVAALAAAIGGTAAGALAARRATAKKPARSLTAP